jgi:hypothetical protein
MSAQASPPRLPRFAILLTLLAFIPTLLFPGDTPWIFDEPAEVAMALQANQQHRLAAEALSGNFRIHYGPMPIQLNQLLLLISHDPRILVFLRALIIASLSGFSLLWLARTLRLPINFAPIVLIAPNIWLWTRQPWAAFLVTPLSLLAIAACASYLKTRHGWSLAITIAAALAMLLIHPQAIPLSIILLLAIVWQGCRDLWLHKGKILLPLVILALLNYQYIDDTLEDLSIPAALAQGHPSQTTRLAAFCGAFQSARLLTPYGFPSPISRSSNPLINLAHWTALLPIPLAILGLLLCLWTAVLTRFNAMADDSQRPQVILSYLMLLIFLAQAIFAALIRLPASPHYQFGLFGPTILAVWLALQRLPGRYFIRAIVISLYSASIALLTLGTIVYVHLHGWPPNQLSPTLNQQIALVHQLNRYPHDSAWTTVPVYLMDPPNALLALRLLYPPSKVSMNHNSTLLISYSQDGQLRLSELPQGTAPPPASKLIPLNYPPGND